jgi:ubiquinone/menaquinone biosynthesis C-methylase UbiE
VADPRLPEPGLYSDRPTPIDHAYYVRYLDFANTSATVQTIERLILERLAPLERGRFLEVGCGTGDDARAMARLVGPGGSVVAIDNSEQMIAKARHRQEGEHPPVDYLLCDAARTGLPSASFDGCRTERVLQHVDDPRAVVAEMARVTRPGGRVVCCEPDWDSIFLDVPDRPTTRAILALRAERQRHPWIGRQLDRLFRDAGLVDVSVELVPTFFRRFDMADRALHLRSSADRAVAAELVSAEAAARWLASLEQSAEAGRFFSVVTSFLARGLKPEVTPSAHLPERQHRQ